MTNVAGRLILRGVGLALLGYLWIAVLVLVAAAPSVVLTLAGLALGISGLLLGCVGIGLAALVVVMMLQPLWRETPPPPGLLVDRDQAPALFNLVDSISEEVGSPRVTAIVVINEFNAAVVEHGAPIALGRRAIYLIIGVPLLLALAPEHIQAVLAHELGHLADQPGSLTGHLCRLRGRWLRLAELLAADHRRSHALLRRFTTWYAPQLAQQVVPLLQAEEYVADRIAAQVASNQRTAEALVISALYSRRLEEEFWTSIARRAVDQATPPAAIVPEMAAFLRTPLSESVAEHWLGQVLSAETTIHDTHPVLRDRLAALGALGRFDSGTAVPPAAGPNASIALLGPAVAWVTDRLNHEWSAHMRGAWRERHALALAARQGLADLALAAEERPLTTDEVWSQAIWTEVVADEATALPLYHRVLAREPEHPGALFAAGRIRLGLGDRAGIELLERVMLEHADAVLVGCRLIHRFLRQQGESEAARATVDRILSQAPVPVTARANALSRRRAA